MGQFVLRPSLHGSTHIYTGSEYIHFFRNLLFKIFCSHCTRLHFSIFRYHLDAISGATVHHGMEVGGMGVRPDGEKGKAASPRLQAFITWDDVKA